MWRSALLTLALAASGPALAQSPAVAVVVSPPNAFVPAGTQQPFTATVVDAASNPVVPQPPVTWTCTGGGTINGSGTFTASALPGGPFFVTATAASLEGNSTVFVSQGSPPTVATPAAANPSLVTGTTTAVSVLGQDSAGEPSLVYTWSSDSPSVTFSPNGTNAAKSSTATFSAPGTYQLQVTLQDPSGLTASSSVSVEVDATPATLTLTPTTASVATSMSLTFQADALDQFGQDMVPQPDIQWSVTGGGSIDPSGVFTADDTPGGPFTVTASAGPRSAAATLNVTNLPVPSFVKPPSASPSPVRGRTARLSALGQDAAGEGDLTYTWSVVHGSKATFSDNGTNSAKDAYVTFFAAGAYKLQLTATDSQGQSVSGAVDITVAETVASFSVQPSSARLKSANDVQQFTVTLKDQFGGPVTPAPPVVWSVNGGGAIDGTGRFTAQVSAGGPFIVTARAGSANAIAAVIVGQSQAPAGKGGCTAGPGAPGLGWAALALWALATRGRRR